MDKKKIAICFSGHLREYESIEKNIQDFFILPLKKEFNVDIFVHTWPTYETEKCSKKFEGRLKSEFLNKFIDVERTFKSLNPIKITIGNESEIFKNANINKLFPNNKINFNSLAAHYLIIDDILTPYCQMYGIYCCNNLKKEVEKLKNFKYDIVFRARLDFYFLRNILDHLSFGKNKLFIPNLYKYKNDQIYALNDTFAFGDSEILDFYSDLILDYKKDVIENNFIYEENDSNLLQYGLEQSLYRRFKNKEIVTIGEIIKKI